MKKCKTPDSQFVILSPPPVETLMGTTEGFDSLWPEFIKNDATIQSQSAMRRDLLRKLSEFTECVPDTSMDISRAVEEGKIDPMDVAELYRLLGDFLDDDPIHSQLVLYLPFELIPSQTWMPSEPHLQDAARRFSEVYLRCWKTLLVKRDVRANFVDGDILESELSPSGQPMVCKAVHLIPVLVAKGFLSVGDVFKLVDMYSDDIFRQSVADVLPILVDLSLLPASEYEETLRKWNVTPHVTSYRGFATPKFDSDVETFLGTLDEVLIFEREKIRMRAVTDESRGLPVSRVVWEERNREDRLVEICADWIEKQMKEGILTLSKLEQFFGSFHCPLSFRSVVRGIGAKIENEVVKNPEDARNSALEFLNHFEAIWVGADEKLREEINRTVIRWLHGGLVAPKEAAWFGGIVPRPDASFLERQKSIEPDVDVLRPIIERFASEKAFKNFFYPVILLFGSRIKGYAKQGADLDIAVFVKPHVSKSERGRVRKLLASVFSEGNIGGKVVEFWLAERNGFLNIRTHGPTADISLADPTWAHILLGSMWLGKENSIRMLHTKLLFPFLSLKGKRKSSHSARNLILEELEREVLQYRLMHRYHELYPKQGGFGGLETSGIDSESAFWDSGYRRLATALFIGKVFLPDRTVKK